MTVDFAALRDADLGALQTLVDTWDGVHGKAVAARTEFDNVSPSLGEDDGWTGEAAAAAHTRGGELLALIRAGIRESYTIKDILSDAKQRFQAAQDDLRAIIDEIAGIPELNLGSTGTVTVDPGTTSVTVPDSPGAATGPQVWEAHASTYQGRIEAAVEAAVTADAEVAEALRFAGETDNTGDGSFNGTALEIDDLRDMRADAARATELLDQDPSELSREELAELNGLLEENREHPVFAAEFMGGLGPRGLLERYGELAIHQWEQQDDGFYGELGDLQRNLGWTLATATDPDNQPHMDAEWAGELMTLGGTMLELDSDYHDPNVFGYEILGPLLRHGVYDEDFIVSVTDHLMRIDAQSMGLFPDTSIGGMDVFDPRAPEGSSFPLDNAMVALDNNPEAAALFFSGSGGYPDVPFMFGFEEDMRPLDPVEGSRVEWFLDRARDDNSVPMNVDNLGNALEAASTGVSPRDTGGVHAPPTEANAQVASEMLGYLGDDDNDDAIDGTDEELSALNDNAANVMVNYMSDVHNIVGDVGTGSGEGLPSWAIPPHTNGLDVSGSDMQRLLEALGKDPDSALRIAVGSEFNANVQLGTTMSQNPGDPGEYAADALTAHGRLMGHLDAGELDQIAADYEAEHSGGVPIADLIAETGRSGAAAAVAVATENPWLAAGARQGAGYVIDFAIDPFRADPAPPPGEELRDASTLAREGFSVRLDDRIEEMLLANGWDEAVDGDIDDEVQNIRQIVIGRYEDAVTEARQANGD